MFLVFSYLENFYLKLFIYINIISYYKLLVIFSKFRLTEFNAHFENKIIFFILKIIKII